MKKQRILFFLFLLVLILPNVILSFTETMNIFGRIALVLLPLAIYGFILTLRRKPGIILWWLFPVLFLGAFQLVLTYLFGEGPIAVDMWLNLLTTNSGEVGELLSQLMPSIIGVIVVYIPTLIFATWSAGVKDKLSLDFIQIWRRIFSIYLLPLALLVTGVASFGKNYKIQDDIFPLNACYNCILAFDRNTKTLSYSEKSRNFKFHAKSTHTDTVPEVIICVVGETSRAMNWSLYGYGRETNPMLKKEPNLVIFRDVMSQSNTTHKSVPILLSPASAEDYEMLYSSKGILAAYREAGYYTCFYSNQRPNKSFIDFLGQQANETVFVKEHIPSEPNDDILLPQLDSILKKGHKRLFIVLHTYGSHFNYYDRYPHDAACFLPDSIPSAEKKYRKELINAYDNSIRYTDSFLSRLIAKLKRTNSSASMLYIPDHGEDIFDDKRNLFLHASPIPSYYQLHVPLLIWTSDIYGSLYPDVLKNLHKNKIKASGSDCVFHTLLGLGGIKTTYLKDSLALTSDSFYPKVRHYLNDHNEPVELKDCLNDQDMKQIKLNKLRDE